MIKEPNTNNWKFARKSATPYGPGLIELIGPTATMEPESRNLLPDSDPMVDREAERA